MKKQFKDLTNMSLAELKKQALAGQDEITKIIFESVSNPQKDTNLVPKKEKKLQGY